VREGLQLREERAWRDRVCVKPKLRLYRLIKSTLKREDYINVAGFEEGKCEFARLRVGTSDLRIETGRHERIDGKRLPVEHRTCLLCLGGIEDEVHIMSECMEFQNERYEMFEQIKNATGGLDMSRYNRLDQMKVLIGDGVEWSRAIKERCRKIVFVYLEKVMKRRKKLTLLLKH
jgi:hypothetical protein